MKFDLNDLSGRLSQFHNAVREVAVAEAKKKRLDEEGEKDPQKEVEEILDALAKNSIEGVTGHAQAINANALQTRLGSALTRLSDKYAADRDLLAAQERLSKARDSILALANPESKQE